MILVRPVLIVVCVTFAILMNSCFGYYDECTGTQNNYCNDSTLAKFYASDEADAWLNVDSLTRKQGILFKSNTGAEIEFATSNLDRITALEITKYQVPVNNDCFENVSCPIFIKQYNYELTYNSYGYGLVLKFNLNRDTADNIRDTNEKNWKEYLSFKQGSYTLKFIPNKDSVGFAKTKFYPTISINNVNYIDVYHVYDSSLINSSNLRIMGFYYNPSNGLLRYYFNKNNDVWTLQ